MRRRLDQAMREGAFGLSSALIYPPGSYASTEEIVDARQDGRRPRRPVRHARARRGRPARGRARRSHHDRRAGATFRVVIYHLKIATRAKWKTMPAIVARIEQARPAASTCRRRRIRIRSPAPASMPRCRTGCTTAATRPCCVAWPIPRCGPRIRRDIEQGHDGWENFLRSAGFEGVTIADVKEGGDTSVIGLTLAEIARRRQQPEWDVFFDLLIAHDGRVAALYALMHEDDVREVLRQPWVTHRLRLVGAAGGRARSRSGGRIRAASAPSRACSAATCATSAWCRCRR